MTTHPHPPPHNLYAHPTLIRNPDSILALQCRLGLRAVPDGHRVRLVGWVRRPRPTPNRNHQTNPNTRRPT